MLFDEKKKLQLLMKGAGVIGQWLIRMISK